MPLTRNPADGTRIYYETQGQGPPLVLIMGLGGPVSAWGMQLPAFVREHRVIALDNRGVGRSDKPDTPYDMATMADDVLAVMDAVDCERAAVLGVSMGGLIAQALYHRAPQRVDRLVLAASGPPVHSADHAPPPPEVGEALHRDRHNTPRREVVAAMAEIFYHPDYRRRVPNLVDLLLAFEDGEQGQPPHAYHRQLEAALGDRTTPDALEAIETPTLVVHGRDDRVWPLANAEALARRLPDGQLHVIERAGHMAMLEQARAFNAAVLGFTANRSSPT